MTSNEIKRLSLSVEGMSCASCAQRVEDAARSLPGVIDALAYVQDGGLILSLNSKTTAESIEKSLAPLLKKLGYELITTAEKSRRKRDLWISAGIGLTLAATFWVADRAGIFALVPTAQNSMGIGALFVLGLLTSLHCLSMCGGIALSQCARVELPRDGKSRGAGKDMLARLLPSLYYNAGRVISYSLVGAAVGALGSVLQPGYFGKALIMAGAGLFMLIMALSMFGLLRSTKFKAGPLTRIQAKFGKAAERFGPFAVGLANGFMPCGPLQAMQLFALASGSALVGGISMFAFAVGTVPLMFAFGAGGAFVPTRYRSIAFRAGAILIAFLGLSTLGRAWALSGLSPALALREPLQAVQPVQQQASDILSNTTSDKAEPRPAAPAVSSGQSETNRAKLRDGKQYVKVAVGSRSYGEIVVRAGIPVVFNLYVAPGNLNGCNNTVIIPSLNIEQRLKIGDNILEFTIDSSGIVPYSCWMGMIRSRIVVENNAP